MIWLNADAQYSALTHSVSASCHIADFCPSQHQIFVAHDLGDGRCYFRDDAPLHSFQLRCACCIVQNEFAELADGQALDGLKGLRFHFAQRCLMASEIRLRAAGLMCRPVVEPVFGGRPRRAGEPSPSRAAIAWSMRVRCSLRAATTLAMSMESFPDL